MTALDTTFDARIDTQAVRVVSTAADLSVFTESDCAAALWQRQIPRDVATWLDTLDPTLLPKGRVTMRPHAVAETVGHLCDMAGTPACTARDWLETDILRLADTMAEVMEAEYLRLRLDVVTTNACRRFHVDAITARLICTYRGQGTQYGIPECGDPTSIAECDRGVPMLLRGSRWPEEPPSGLLHRSPPIEGTGETRLLLVIDPILDEEDDF